MKAFIFALVLLLVACPSPHPEGFSHEERLQRRKKFQKEIIDCILNNDISKDLKQKLEENKDEDLRHIIHLFMGKINSQDKEAIRKCRREVFTKMRDMFRERRHDHFMNRTKYRHHLFDHEENQTIHEHPYHSDHPEHPEHHEHPEHLEHPEHHEHHEFNKTVSSSAEQKQNLEENKATSSSAKQSQ